ncbi:oxidoreductase [Devosia sediminis]|uniref:SDR family oxidoreductase n=1 Tax=Devosia sediminis TaxID=2798801 RepID=A0A934IXN9_9HYPH|nr:oxidoreductase [Devosia sediminis]MBJ3786292.1 SDR family oxidoreductase [Devosia sediminis]
MQISSETTIPDQSGRIALVTGAAGGLGLEISRMLAASGARVILAGRDVAKGEAALRSLPRQGDLSFERIDLADLGSIRDAAARLSAQIPRLDLLINNAGVMAPRERGVTADGFELQLGTNHLGHFALTSHLQPLLQAARGRVVSVASIAARFGRIDFDDLQSEGGYNPFRAYAQSKLANLLFARELQRRSDEGGWGIKAVSAHPGWARTELFRHGRSGISGRGEKLLEPLVSQSAAAGALPIVAAALEPHLPTDAYIGPGHWFELKNPPGPASVPRAARNADTARRLWEASEALTQVNWLAMEGQAHG